MPTKSDNDGQFLRQLSITQRNAIDLMVAGKSDAEVAHAVGVTRQTVCGWRNHHPAFIAELNAQRQGIWGAAGDRLRGLLPSALDSLESALTAEPPDWRAAIKVLEVAGLKASMTPPTGPVDSVGVLDEMVRRQNDEVMRELLLGSVSDGDRDALVRELARRLGATGDHGA
jgi:hypothetical protein